MNAAQRFAALCAAGLLAAAVLLAGSLAWLASVPPAVIGADAPPGIFSAARAMADVRAVGRLPHPAGSAEHDRVRAQLTARMAALGLAPRLIAGPAIKVAAGADGTRVSGAEVANLLGILHGTDPRAPAVLLMAHYDSVPSSSGAADDGVGLAAGLEVIRALRAGPPPRRDVMLLFSDAEENGLLGARAFFAGPEARRAGFVINMDMRGGAGRAVMHETGQHAGGAVALYRRSAIHPTSDSIAGYVERLIRNSSDFRVTQDAGRIGLNFAILDRQFDYHAASSTPATLDPRSLQHVGEQVLAATRLAAMAEALPAAAPDPAFASVLGWQVVAYPAWGGWLVLAAGLGLVAVAWRRTPVAPGALVRAGAAALYLLLLLIVLAGLARFATGVPFGFAAVRPLLARWDQYEAMLILVGVAGVAGWWAMALAGARRLAVIVPLLVAVALLLLQAGWVRPGLAAGAALLAIPAFGRPLTARAIGFGLWGGVALLALVIQATAPVAAVLASWSVLGGGAVLLAATVRRPWGLVAASAIAVPLVAQQLGTGHLLLLTVGDTLGEVAGPFAWFVALALAPLLARAIGARGAAVVALIGGVAAVALLLAIRLGDPATAARPGLSQIVHVADLSNGHFYRATGLAAPDRWTNDALGGAGGGAGAMLPVYDHAFVRRAERVAVVPPRIVSAKLPDGRVMLRIAGPPGTREIRVALAATVAVARSWVNGLPAPLLARAGRMDRLYWVGRDPVVTLLLAPSAPGRLVARIATLRDGWPADARPLPPRPPTTMPWYDSDATITLSTASISW